MEPWVMAVFGSGGGLAGIYALIRHRMNTRLIKHALDTKGEDGVDAVSRALHPGVAALRGRRPRRAAQRKPPSPIQPALRE